MTLYQPEGSFGPICDPGSSARAEAPIVQAAAAVDPYVTVDPPDGRDRNFPAEIPTLIRTECKQRILPNGSIEYYDCRVVTNGDPDIPFNGTTCVNNSGVCFNWEEESQAGFGITDNFFVPRLGPDSCVPYRPDINIRPTIFTDGGGVKTIKYARERSSPVTFPVDAFYEEDGVNLWNENGTEYAVWTNPEQCTLPCIPQEVTYTITFPDTDTYHFEFGADDSGRFFIDDDPSPILDIQSGIGYNSTPWKASRTITAGIHTIIVQCTNNNSLFVASDANMQYAANVLLVRVDGTEERGDFGFQNISSANYFSPIARAIADEYLSGRFGRTESVGGQYASSGRPPEPSGMQTHVDYYVAAGGSLTDDPVNPTIWANTKTNSILVGFNLGENTAALVQGVFYPSCSVGTRNGLLESDQNSTAYEWRYNPGGWYLKICKGGPCSAGNNLDWVPVGPISAWNTFMNNYAIWPEFDNPLVGTTQSITHSVTINVSDTYTLEYACDNSGTWYWNGTQVATFTSFTTTGTYSFTAAPGVYDLKMDVVNVSVAPTPDEWTNNPAGGAWLLTNSNGDIIASSRDLNTAGNGNLFWHTRLASGYEYIEQIV